MAMRISTVTAILVAAYGSDDRVSSGHDDGGGRIGSGCDDGDRDGRSGGGSGVGVIGDGVGHNKTPKSHS
ncbi:Hypothetical predicted protein [Octopus vulgaris]|uniref:Uncharacterized protein n=1 Tax=Octopus vulgaris TaxID=6645 RepID=A0AA36AL43_OCTVU|nr:Hypothetical predicted protein [Octopus vulgaris]